jgi:hypothetical protein
MLDVDTLHKASFVAAFLAAVYQGPNLLRWAINAVPSRPKDREVRSSQVVDSAVAAKLARQSRPVVQEASAPATSQAPASARPDYDHRRLNTLIQRRRLSAPLFSPLLIPAIPRRPPSGSSASDFRFPQTDAYLRQPIANVERCGPSRRKQGSARLEL